MATMCCELKWLKCLIAFLSVSHLKPMLVYCDSQALHITANPVFHECTKHIEIDYHFIRYELSFGHISTHYVSTREQLTDILTKGLDRAQFDYLSGKSTIRNLHALT